MKHPINFSELEFPKSFFHVGLGKSNDNACDAFPMLADIDDNGDEVANPLIKLMQEGKSIEAVQPLYDDDWTDDHELCMNVIVTVDGKKYGFSAWWLSEEGVTMMENAERMKRKALKDLKEYILSYA